MTLANFSFLLINSFPSLARTNEDFREEEGRQGTNAVASEDQRRLPRRKEEEKEKKRTNAVACKDQRKIPEKRKRETRKRTNPSLAGTNEGSQGKGRRTKKERKEAKGGVHGELNAKDLLQRQESKRATLAGAEG